jgi:ABC-2 type transport system ATP-binding protein
MVSQQHGAIVQARDVTKRFGDIIAVDHISFTIEKGEIFGFLGPNGAGKTTTVRALTGLITPDSGEIVIDGENLGECSVSAKRKMGVIPEMCNVYGDLSARENIALSGRFYGFRRKEIKRKTDELLAMFELGERGNDPVRIFSKGMMQRVNIASALAHNPRILILDEPTSGLDVKSQRMIKEVVKGMNEEGTTVILTTHNMEEANSLCDRVCILFKGKIVAIDRPENLRETSREAQSVEIAFDISVANNGLPDCDAVSKVEKFGDRWKLYTSDPDRVVKHLVEHCRDRGLVITSLAICKASLEDVFLALTEDRDHAELTL